MKKTRFSCFLDVEKEIYGVGEITLFIFDMNQSQTIVDPDQSNSDDPEFSFSEIVELVTNSPEIERVYIGARETDIDPEWACEFITDLSTKVGCFTYETSRLEDAERVREYYRSTDGSDYCPDPNVVSPRVCCVWRTSTNVAVKFRRPNSLVFVQGMELWNDHSEVTPSKLKSRLTNG